MNPAGTDRGVAGVTDRFGVALVVEGWLRDALAGDLERPAFQAGVREGDRRGGCRDEHVVPE